MSSLETLPAQKLREYECEFPGQVTVRDITIFPRISVTLCITNKEYTLIRTFTYTKGFLKVEKPETTVFISRRLVRLAEHRASEIIQPILDHLNEKRIPQDFSHLRQGKLFGDRLS